MAGAINHEISSLLSDSLKVDNEIIYRLPIPLLVVDEDGMVRRANAVAEEVTRQTQQELVGTSFTKIKDLVQNMDWDQETIRLGTHKFEVYLGKNK